ncbi:hypothetical protein N9164_12535 [Draconibacterium sp.]|nr:hypothetical protein [Draconibacterium sp.]
METLADFLSFVATHAESIKVLAGVVIGGAVALGWIDARLAEKLDRAVAMGTNAAEQLGGDGAAKFDKAVEVIRKEAGMLNRALRKSTPTALEGPIEGMLAATSISGGPSGKKQPAPMTTGGATVSTLTQPPA